MGGHRQCSWLLDGTAPCKQRLQKQMRDSRGFKNRSPSVSLRAFRNRSDHAGTGKGRKHRARGGTLPRNAGGPAICRLLAKNTGAGNRRSLSSPIFFMARPLVGFDPSEITGSLVVIEGMGRVGTVDARLPCCQGMAGIGRLCGADERTAPFESGGTGHR